jgi:hypothetical protein
MSEQDIFFSILVERLIQIRYKADRGLNPNIVTVYNPKGWTLHIQRDWLIGNFRIIGFGWLGRLG